MDKFDQSIIDAQESHEPSGQFVDNTMREIGNHQPEVKRGFKMHFWIPVAVGGVVVVVLVFALLPSGKTNAPGTTGKSSVATTGSPTKEQQQSGTVPAGTDNANLASDLNSVQGAMNQESTDQNGANTALNDQQQEITVPTN